MLPGSVARMIRRLVELIRTNSVHNCITNSFEICSFCYSPSRCIHFNFLQSGERNGTPSRRSKSEGPPLANGRCVNALDHVSQEKQIKEKVFSISLIFYAKCGMSMSIITVLTNTQSTQTSVNCARYTIRAPPKTDT